MDNTTIKGFYSNLKRAKGELHQAVLARIEAKRAFDSARLRGLVDGTIAGKNADVRAASAAEVLAEQQSALRLAEADERNARLTLDLAQLDVDALQTELKLLEITQ